MQSSWGEHIFKNRRGAACHPRCSVLICDGRALDPSMRLQKKKKRSLSELPPSFLNYSSGRQKINFKYNQDMYRTVLDHVYRLPFSVSLGFLLFCGNGFERSSLKLIISQCAGAAHCRLTNIITTKNETTQRYAMCSVRQKYPFQQNRWNTPVVKKRLLHAVEHTGTLQAQN